MMFFQEPGRVVMQPILVSFFNTFQRKFTPPPPRPSQNGAAKYVSGAWGQYLKDWPDLHFDPIFEYPVPGGSRRLDAALRSGDGATDYAVEWEWDYNKVYRDFAYNDFRKVVADVPARCGIAIVQTRTDGNYGATEKADEALKRIRASYSENLRDGRPVGLIEIRRTRDDETCVQFRCSYEELGSAEKMPPNDFRFSGEQE